MQIIFSPLKFRVVSSIRLSIPESLDLQQHKSLNIKSRIFIPFGKHHAAGIACFDVSPQFSSPAQLTKSSMENLRFVKQFGLKDNCGLSSQLLYTSGCSGLVSVGLQKLFLLIHAIPLLLPSVSLCALFCQGTFSSSDSLPLRRNQLFQTNVTAEKRASTF